MGSCRLTGNEKASPLFAESDGIWLRLQREKDKHGKQRKHYELKNAIAYTGWKRLSQKQERSGKTAQKNRIYVLKRLEKGMDWRKKAESLGFQVPEGVRGLGAIEGNQSHLFSDRMKDRGMSWAIKGVQHMGKAIQLVANGELKHRYLALDI